MTPAERFGANLRLRRNALGLTQSQLAVTSGLAVSEISRLERGERDPRLGTIKRLADALAARVADLVYDI